MTTTNFVCPACEMHMYPERAARHMLLHMTERCIELSNWWLTDGRPQAANLPESLIQLFASTEETIAKIYDELCVRLKTENDSAMTPPKPIIPRPVPGPKSVS